MVATLVSPPPLTPKTQSLRSGATPTPHARMTKYFQKIASVAIPSSALSRRKVERSRGWAGGGVRKGGGATGGKEGGAGGGDGRGEGARSTGREGGGVDRQRKNGAGRRLCAYVKAGRGRKRSLGRELYTG